MVAQGAEPPSRRAESKSPRESSEVTVTLGPSPQPLRGPLPQVRLWGSTSGLLGACGSQPWLLFLTAQTPGGPPLWMMKATAVTPRLGPQGVTQLDESCNFSQVGSTVGFQAAAEGPLAPSNPLPQHLQRSWHPVFPTPAPALTQRRGPVGKVQLPRSHVETHPMQTISWRPECQGLLSATHGHGRPPHVAPAAPLGLWWLQL